jgi:uncharacterized cupin superfamily protein
VPREASSEETPYGRYVTSDGWFVLNLEDALAVRNDEKGGATYPLEGQEAPFRDVGVRVRILWPGDPNGLYHSEDVQEGFLVLSGECVAVVEGEERRMRQWDFLHCPAGTPHVFVGAGDGPCAVLMIGSRREDRAHYPVDAAAAKYGASVTEETDDVAQAYAVWRQEPRRPAPNPWPPR